jgi:pyruvate dehydrogenase E2 component (dihydrolipoamide acetyltransferase)
VFASPLAKRVAAEKGINIEDVIGTGIDGSITRQDVENYVSRS